MNTTGIVLSLTDEQLKDIDEYCEMTQHIESGEQACVSLYELRGLLEELSRLRAENAGLAKDAGRYRWLRDSIWYVGPDDFYCGEGGDMNEYQNHNFNAETLDASIDTAMAAQ